MKINNKILIYLLVFIIGIFAGRFSYKFLPAKNLVNHENIRNSAKNNSENIREEKEKRLVDNNDYKIKNYGKIDNKNKKLSHERNFSDTRPEKDVNNNNFDQLKKYVQQESVKNYIHAKFENMSDYEVVDFLKNYIHISDKDIPKGTTAVDFAARLGEIFTNGVDKAANEDGSTPQNVEFDIATNGDFQAVSPTQEFSTSDKKIYASFNTENYQADKVMVKWYRVDDPKVYIFDKYDISTDKNNNFVWLEKPSGWNEGLYGVEVYSMEDNLSLMAYGEYAVNKK